MRLFIALNLDPRIRELIASAIDTFPVDRPPWRWTRPDTWHITLKFLGDTPQTEVAPITRSLEQVATRYTRFQLSLRGFGGFPNLRRPRVLFYRSDEGASVMERLAGDVNRSLHADVGIPVEEKRFRGHVTVARVKSRLPAPVVGKLRTVPPLEGAVQTVGSIDLMKSDLRPDGARYERLKGFALPQAS